MSWFKIATNPNNPLDMSKEQIDRLSYEEFQEAEQSIHKLYADVYWRQQNKTTLPADKGLYEKIMEVREWLHYKNLNYEKERSVLKQQASEAIQSGESWRVPKKWFMDYHRTGSISSNAYQKYSDREGIAWLGGKDKNPVLHSKKIIDGKEIEFRQSGEKSEYVKTNDQDEIVRDSNGMAIYMSDEEVLEQGLNLYETSMVAYDEQGPIGWVSNEFGAPGVWVIDEYQKKGIGTYLLSEWMKKRKPSQKIGQMTQQGYNMTLAYHRQLIQKARREGKSIPPEVLQSYPELNGK